jgi:hypothetical protein
MAGASVDEDFSDTRRERDTDARPASLLIAIWPRSRGKDLPKRGELFPQNARLSDATAYAEHTEVLGSGCVTATEHSIGLWST